MAGLLLLLSSREGLPAQWMAEREMVLSMMQARATAVCLLTMATSLHNTASTLPTASGKNPWAKTTLKVWASTTRCAKNNRERILAVTSNARKDQVMTAARLKP